MANILGNIFKNAVSSLLTPNEREYKVQISHELFNIYYACTSKCPDFAALPSQCETSCDIESVALTDAGYDALIEAAQTALILSVAACATHNIGKSLYRLYNSSINSRAPVNEEGSNEPIEQPSPLLLPKIVRR